MVIVLRTGSSLESQLFWVKLIWKGGLCSQGYFITRNKQMRRKSSQEINGIIIIVMNQLSNSIVYTCGFSGYSNTLILYIKVSLRVMTRDMDWKPSFKYICTCIGIEKMDYFHWNAYSGCLKVLIMDTFRWFLLFMFVYVTQILL